MTSHAITERVSPDSSVHVSLRQVSKRFGGVKALTDIDLNIHRGSIHALVGENGAGKSTLGKVVAGLLAPDAGEMLVDGQVVSFSRPREALALGITCIAQELALVSTRSVLENVFLGRESTRAGALVSSRSTKRRWEELVNQTGFDLNPRATVGDLRLADQQKVEILRALAREARLIVLDEPTASLPAPDVQLLLDILRRLRADGTTIVYVSHFLSEVLSVADEVTVLKDGRHVSSRAAADCDEHGLVTQMLGRSLERAHPPKPAAPSGESARLRVEGLSSPNGVRDVSLAVRPGEILGVAGLAGSGRSELLHALLGADRGTGLVEIDGSKAALRSPRHAVARGVTLIPESRKEQGLMLARSVEANLTLGATRKALAGRSRAGRREAVRELVARLGVKASALSVPAGTLSGGNQQKLMFGRCLLQRPGILLVDEPTRGVDVGAKFAIYELLVGLANEGMSIVMVSSEMNEILELSHRVAVMRAGTIAAVFDGDAITEQNVLLAAFGTEPNDEGSPWEPQSLSQT